MKGKKMMSALLSTVMCASLLAGCGSAEEDTSKEISDTLTATATPQEAAGEISSEAAEGETTAQETTEATTEGWSYTNVETLENPDVTMALYWEPDAVVQSAIDAFEEKYGGTVTVNVVGWNKGATAIQEAMATGDLFDIVYTEGNARFPGDAVDELYQPIDEYLDYSVCDAASVDAFLFKGNHYVYTNYAITSPYLIIYNKTIFEEEALVTPTELYENGQWTYDKFLEYMEYFTRDTDGDGEIDQWGLGPRYKRQNFGYANGAMPVYEVGNGELAVDIDSEECKQYFAFLTEFNKIDTNCPGDGNWLETRMCVMFSEAGPSAGLSGEATTDEFDFVPIPTYNGSLATTPVWDNGYAIVNGAPNPEGAAVLASMICEAKADNYETDLQTKYNEEQIERYYTIMEKIVPQRRKYTDVNVGAGEAEALEGTPAQTIIETYKSQLESEVAAYNENINK